MSVKIETRSSADRVVRSSTLCILDRWSYDFLELQFWRFPPRSLVLSWVVMPSLTEKCGHLSSTDQKSALLCSPFTSIDLDFKSYCEERGNTTVWQILTI